MLSNLQTEDDFESLSNLTISPKHDYDYEIYWNEELDDYNSYEVNIKSEVDCDEHVWECMLVEPDDTEIGTNDGPTIVKVEIESPVEPNYCSNVEANEITESNSSIDNKTNLKLTKDEAKFIVSVMSEKEMQKTRDLDRNRQRYKAAKFKCANCIKGYYQEEKYKQHLRDFHSEVIIFF